MLFQKYTPLKAVLATRRAFQMALLAELLLALVFIYNKVNPGSVETFLLVTVVTFSNRYVCLWIVSPFWTQKEATNNPRQRVYVSSRIEDDLFVGVEYLVYTNIYIFFSSYTHHFYCVYYSHLTSHYPFIVLIMI